MFTEQMTQAVCIPAASMFPNTYASGSTTIGPFDVLGKNSIRRVMGHVMAGVLGTNSVVTAYFQSSNNNAGGSFTNVASAVTATLSSANTETTIEMRADQMPAGSRYLALVVNVSNNTSQVAASLYTSEPAYKPCNQGDTSTLVTRQIM